MLIFFEAILMPLFGITVILFFAIFLSVMYFDSRRSERLFKINTLEILREKNKKIPIEKLENAHNTYQNKGYGFGYKSIIQLNQELAEDIRTGKYKKYYKSDIKSSDFASRLDDLTKIFKEKYRFDDEKINELFERLSDVNQLQKSEVEQEIKHYIIRLNNIHEGRLIEKNLQLEDLRKKLTRKHWFAWIVGVIGTLGSIYSILSYYR